MRTLTAFLAVSLACFAAENNPQFKVGFDDQILPQIVDGGGWRDFGILNWPSSAVYSGPPS
jgi:hypothetical protein